MPQPYKRAIDLQDEKYTLVTDFAEYHQIALDAGLNKSDAFEITGAIVAVGDGEYTEIWLTQASKPWELMSYYYPAEFWRKPSA